jgi:hypothetical protein
MSPGPHIAAAESATPRADDHDEVVLAGLADLDLLLVRKVHAKAMAAEMPADIADLARTYQRISRSLRQNLALKAKLRRERLADAGHKPPPAASHLDADRMARAHRFDEIAQAVLTTARSEGLEDAECEAAFERFQAEAWDWTEKPDFMEEPLTDLIDRALDLVLPEEDAVEAGGAAEGPGVDRQTIGGQTIGGQTIEGQAREVPAREAPNQGVPPREVPFNPLPRDDPRWDRPPWEDSG